MLLFKLKIKPYFKEKWLNTYFIPEIGGRVVYKVITITTIERSLHVRYASILKDKIEAEPSLLSSYYSLKEHIDYIKSGKYLTVDESDVPEKLKNYVII